MIATGDISGWTPELTKFHEWSAGMGNHYIDQASRKYTLSELQKIVTPDAIILEIGSSSGFLLSDIKEMFPEMQIIGSDYVPDVLNRIRERLAIPLIQLDLTSLPLKDKSVGIIIATNVLEHIEDDNKALQEISRILKPNGVVLLEVPSNPELYDFYDQNLRHFRRYTIEDLKQKVMSSEMIPDSMSHLGFFIYPAFWIAKSLNKRRGNQPLASVKDMIGFGGSTASFFLSAIMNVELYIGKWIGYPVGIRCLITARAGGPS